METTLLRRLDATLVRMGLATGREAAKRLIEAGRVTINGVVASKAATQVADDDTIRLAGDEITWASRGGLKLEQALDEFDLDPGGMKALDVGASTGGFTDVLLARGAASVTAVDVGYGQLVWRLRQDPRVAVFDRTNFRTVDIAGLGGPFDFIVVDVSFISVELLAPNLAAAATPTAVLVVLVKPQFELEPGLVGRGGIVRDPQAHREAILQVATALEQHGFGATGLVRSPITGAKGNVEFLLRADREAASALDPGTVATVTSA